MSLLAKMMKAQKENNSNIATLPKNVRPKNIEEKSNPFKNIKTSNNPFLKKLAEKKHEEEQKAQEENNTKEAKEEVNNVSIEEIDNSDESIKLVVKDEEIKEEQLTQQKKEEPEKIRQETNLETKTEAELETEEDKIEDTDSNEEEKEEESKKTTRKRRTSKKKSATKSSLESTELENIKHSNLDIFGMKISFEEAAEILYANFVSPEWIEFRNSVTEELEGIKITSDINPGTIKVITEELNNLYDRIAIPLAHAKSLISIISDKDCGVGTVKKTEAAVYSESTNAVSRAKAGFDALQDVDINGTSVNLLNVLLSAKVRYAFLEGIKDRIEFKRQSLVLAASALKIDAGLTY